MNYTLYERDQSIKRIHYIKIHSENPLIRQRDSILESEQMTAPKAALSLNFRNKCKQTFREGLLNRKFILKISMYICIFLFLFFLSFFFFFFFSFFKICF